MCGLVGYVGKYPNLDKLKIMAIYNDSRGGDGVGFVINDTIYKYNKHSYYEFQDVFEFSEVNKDFTLESPGKEQVILMHSRKGSVGSIVGTDNNHPFELKSEEGNCLIGVHNGTIKNIQDLAAKYEVTKEELDTLGKTDSELLFHIINKTQSYDVLSYYEGGAALLWYNPENPKELFAFKGASESFKNYSYYANHYYGANYDTGPTEERPLYLVMTANGTYFSSIKASLFAVGFLPGEIMTIEANKVCKFRKGKLIDSTVVERKTPYYVPKKVDTIKTASPVEEDKVNLKKNLYYIGDTKMHGFYWIDEDDKSGYLIEKLDDFIDNVEYYVNALFSDFCNESGYYLFYNGYIIKDFEKTVIQKFALDKNKYQNLCLYPTILSKYAVNPILEYSGYKVANVPKKSYTFEYPLLGTKVIIDEKGLITKDQERVEKFASVRFINHTDSYSESKWKDVSNGKDSVVGVLILKEGSPSYFKCRQPGSSNPIRHTYFKVDEEVEVEDEFLDYVEVIFKKNKLKKFFNKKDSYKIGHIKDSRTVYVYDDNETLRELTLNKSFRLIKESSFYYQEEEDFYDMDDPFYTSENPQVVNNYISKLNKSY